VCRGSAAAAHDSCWFLSLAPLFAVGLAVVHRPGKVTPTKNRRQRQRAIASFGYLRNPRATCAYTQLRGFALARVASGGAWGGGGGGVGVFGVRYGGAQKSPPISTGVLQGRGAGGGVCVGRRADPRGGRGRSRGAGKVAAPPAPPKNHEAQMAAYRCHENAHRRMRTIRKARTHTEIETQGVEFGAAWRVGVK
jgi:hypothetical protein